MCGFFTRFLIGSYFLFFEWQLYSSYIYESYYRKLFKNRSFIR